MVGTFDHPPPAVRDPAVRARMLRCAPQDTPKTAGVWIDADDRLAGPVPTGRIELTRYSSTVSAPGATLAQHLGGTCAAGSPAPPFRPWIPPLPRTSRRLAGRRDRLGRVLCGTGTCGFLAFTGTDAEDFLQGQLSNDVAALAPGTAAVVELQLRPRAGCSRRCSSGAMAAKHSARWSPADLAETLRKRLSMYVLRAKVAVARRHRRARAVRRRRRRRAGRRPRRRSATRRSEAVSWLAMPRRWSRLPDGRVIIVAPAASAAELRATLAASMRRKCRRDVWRWLGIRAGVPTIAPATQDLFVPQTANWDLLGGVSFQKGCYPGQEIVARTQYLGRLKERMHLFHVDAPPPPPGTRIYGAVFGDQACGTVVDAAPSPPAGSDLLAVVQMTALDGPLHLGSPDGPALAPLPLPYAIPAPARRIARSSHVIPPVVAAAWPPRRSRPRRPLIAMCLVVVALDAHPRYALVVAANRDEFHARAALARALGRGAAVRRHPRGPRPHRGRHLARRAARRPLGARHQRARGRPQRSRRAVARRTRAARSSTADRAGRRRSPALMRDAGRYNGFNLLAGDASTARRGCPIARREARDLVAAACTACRTRCSTRRGRRSCAPGTRVRRLGRARRHRPVAAVRRARRSHAGARRRPAGDRRIRSSGSGCCRRRSSSATTTARAARRCSRSTAKRQRALRRALVRRATARQSAKRRSSSRFPRSV